MAPRPRDGACIGHNPSLFIITDGAPHEISQARALCDSCCVKDECRDWAFAGEARSTTSLGLCGIYGGILFTPTRGTKAAEIAAEIGMPVTIVRKN